MTILKVCPKLYPQNSGSKCLYQNTSWKLSQKQSLKMTALKCCPKSYPQKQLLKIFVPKFYVKKRSKNYHWKWPYWNAAQNSTAKTVVQNVRSKILAGIAFEELLLKVTVLKCCPKRIRKNSRSKCRYRNYSWISVRKTITEKDRTEMLAKTVSAITVLQTIRIEVLGEIASEKNYHLNDRT